MLIVLEDLRWADELSLDVLGHLAGCLATRPGLVVGAYRCEELHAGLPMRVLRARLLGQRFAKETRLSRLSPSLWGLAEAALCRGDYGTALTLCERGYQASADVMDAAYLFPYLLTGVRAYLARGDIDAAESWSDRVGAVLTVRAIPGAEAGIGEGHGPAIHPTGKDSLEATATPFSRRCRACRRVRSGRWPLSCCRQRDARVRAVCRVRPEQRHKSAHPASALSAVRRMTPTVLDATAFDSMECEILPGHRLCVWLVLLGGGFG